MLVAIVAAVCGFLFLAGAAYQAYANQLTAFVNPQQNKVYANYTAVAVLLIQYPQNSSLSHLFNNKSDIVTASTTNADSPGILNSINDAFARTHSNIRALSTDANYSAKIEGLPDSTRIAFVIHANPVLQNVVMGKQQDSDIVDLQWKRLVVTESIPLYSTELDKVVDINKPIGLLEAKYPTLASILKENESVARILNTPLFNISQFDVPMSKWHYVFDPTGILANSSALLNENGNKLASRYTYGTTAENPGFPFQYESYTASTIVNGSLVKITVGTLPYAKISTAGYSTVYNDGSKDTLLISNTPPVSPVKGSEDWSLSSYMFIPFIGIGAAIAGVIAFLKLRKQNR